MKEAEAEAEDGVSELSPGLWKGRTMTRMQSTRWRKQQQDERLLAIREDIAEWLNTIMGLDLSEQGLMARLADGIVVCELAQLVEGTEGEEDTGLFKERKNSRSLLRNLKRSAGDLHNIKINKHARAGSFQARDNVSNFLSWCRKIGMPGVVLFESNDLVEGRNEKAVLFSLLEIGRVAARRGIEPPQLIALELEIEEELRLEEERAMFNEVRVKLTCKVK